METRRDLLHGITDRFASCVQNVARTLPPLVFLILSQALTVAWISLLVHALGFLPPLSFSTCDTLPKVNGAMGPSSPYASAEPVTYNTVRF